MNKEVENVIAHRVELVDPVVDCQAEEGQKPLFATGVDFRHIGEITQGVILQNIAEVVKMEAGVEAVRISNEAKDQEGQDEEEIWIQLSE